MIVVGWLIHHRGETSTIKRGRVATGLHALHHKDVFLKNLLLCLVFTERFFASVTNCIPRWRQMFSKTLKLPHLSRNKSSGILRKLMGLASPGSGTSEPTAKPAQVAFRTASDSSLKTFGSVSCAFGKPLAVSTSFYT